MARIISISPHAASDSNSGHFYWMYRYMANGPDTDQSQATQTIGPRSSDGEHIIGAIADGARRRKFAVAPFFYRRDGWQDVEARVSDLGSAGYDQFQLYDGGLAELLVAIRLASRFPQYKFLYNFHWALQWLDFVDGNGFAGAARLWVLDRSLRAAPRNLVFTAETKKLAGLLEDKLHKKFLEYPIFSFFTAQTLTPWPERQFDITIFASSFSADETIEAFRIADMASKNRLSARVVTSREMYNEFLFSSNQPRDSADAELTLLPLSTGDYQELFSSTRLALLAYSDPYFRWGSSGKFNDAISCGAFPLVPNGSAIATQSGLAPEDHSYPANDLRECMRGCVKRLARGMDTNIQPKSIADLGSLFEFAHHPQERSVAASRTQQIPLTVVAWMYREQSLWVRLRAQLAYARSLLRGL